MPRYFIIADGEIEEKISVALYKELKEKSPRSPVFFLSLLMPGNFRQRGLKETRWRGSRHGVLFWYSFCKTLWRRRRWKEDLILIGERTFPLFLIFVLTGKKAFFISISKTWEGSFGLFQVLLMRYFARTVFLNDQDRVKELRQHNIPAYFSGNLLADLLLPGDFSFPAGGKTVFSLFPRASHVEHDLGFLEETADIIASRMPAYFLLVIPKGVKVQEIKEKAEKTGWRWRRSLEGEVMEGYLCKDKTYINVTTFYQEALKQSDFVISFDSIRVIQAVGLGRKIIPVSALTPKEVAALLANPTYLFEYNLFLSRRFGEQGGIGGLACFLLFGVVEDRRFIAKGA
ncbi:MAG: hypothetical protein N2Z84_03525 [Atribacterota bacterium]|nr:hypothetical protein [Atribacterota bacterium]